MIANPEISVTICTCDRHDLLPDAIESVLQQTYQPLELIVVDNSADPAAVFAKQYQAGDRIRYVHEPAPGLSNARNRGTGLARGKIVAFMDDDAVASPDWAEKLAAAFAAFGPKAGCVGGRIVPRWLAPRPLWLGDDLLGYLSIVDWKGPLRKLRKGEWLAGCNIAFDRAALLAAGGFPANLGRQRTGRMLLSNEEIAVCGRIAEAGKLVVYAPDATVEHRIGAERLTEAWFLRRAAWQAVSDFIISSRKTKTKALCASLWRRAWLKTEGSGFFMFRAVGCRARFKRKMARMYNLTREFLYGCDRLAGEDIIITDEIAETVNALPGRLLVGKK